MSLKKQGYQYLIQGDYQKAANLYKHAIEESETVNISYYWYLGLALLLGEQEVEAQMTWMLPLSDGDAEEIEQRAVELVQVLETEAERLKELQKYKSSWLIRQHIHEICPDNLDNLLHIIQLSPNLNIYNDEELHLCKVTHLLRSKQYINFNSDLLLQILKLVLEVYPLQIATFEFIKACLYNQKNFIEITQILSNEAAFFINSLSREQLLTFSEICLQLANNQIRILGDFANLFQNANRYLESLKFTQRILELTPILIDQVAAYYLTVRGLMQAGGQWQNAEAAHDKYEFLLSTLIESNTKIDEEHLLSLLATVVFSPYFKDEPANNHYFRNQVAKYCQYHIQSYSNNGLGLFQIQELSSREHNFTRPLKIGYVSTCLQRHSVGWLARWLFEYHNQEKFKIHVYSLRHSSDSLQSFIAQKASAFYDLSEVKEIVEIANLIHEDQIDILIDLDSVTSRQVCGVMALKPAPVQVTWLGSDASGLPAIDYFIADPYVLPESADNYYASKIWRLPSTYVAVDGFEVGIPTLRREELNIPNNAIIYLTSQTAYKRHPNTVRLQIKILKQVAGSYLLIKGQSNQDTIKRFFEQIAEEEGVDSSRLRFLPLVDSELVHRANLDIADVVLDTYPYNGATTTLETLWMGIPLITKVGEQFAARNSYTMMVNAGITEGIAWTDEEYIEWGIRLGKDVDLRQQVVWKLRQSKHTAPLWNAKQFTRDMESAYEQMWQRYLEGK